MLTKSERMNERHDKRKYPHNYHVQSDTQQDGTFAGAIRSWVWVAVTNKRPLREFRVHAPQENFNNSVFKWSKREAHDTRVKGG